MESEERLIDLEEAARMVGVSSQTVRRWAQTGRLPYFKPGRKYLLRARDVEQFIAEHEIPKVQAPLEGPAPSPEERRAGYVRAWRAFVWKLVHRWEEDPPESEREIGVLLDTMQVLLDEGAFEQPADEITTADRREASEWVDLQFIFRGIDRLNRIADTVETNAEAGRRRATFEVIEGRMSA
jgi:excisionase family DNA binding protein